jgi:hypothetical protein
MPIADTLNALRAFAFPALPARPRLLFAAEDLPALRMKTAAQPGMVPHVQEQVRTLTATPGETIDTLQPYISGGEAVRVAEAYALVGDPALAAWVLARLDGLLAMDTWFSPVHANDSWTCDHVMANVAAQVALCRDLLGDAVAPADAARIAAGVERLHFTPFLDNTSGNVVWWFRPDCQSNWKIMTCGDTGLAACGFLGEIAHANEILARATNAVVEILDAVPPEGDWGEGVGYWFGTLQYGLRLARALRRLSGGAINLFDHPALQVTGDFLVMLTTPAGRVFNFNDCDPDFNLWQSEVLTMLAAESGRADWMAIARKHPVPTLSYLAFDDPAVPAEMPTRAAAAFPSSGSATLRAGWSEGDLFVGLKSGPAQAGHSHLDANAILLEANGARLLTDYSYWPQAHFLGYFNTSGPRWTFDGLSTEGHSTLLVDGLGQTYADGCGGRILDARDEGGWAVMQAEGAGAYPGLLTRYTRTVLLLKPDIVVIRDVIACDGPRRLDWLLHYNGAVRTAGIDTFIEAEGVRLAVTPLLPDRSRGWRVSDVERTSTYECSDTRKDVTRTIRYRSFSILPRVDALEFLVALRVNGNGSADWTFMPAEDGWTLAVADRPAVIMPAGDGMAVR